MTEPHVPAPRRAAFAFVFVTVLLDMFAIGIIIPVLPRLVEDFMGGDTARAATIYGIFGTAWALMQFLFMPVLGSLSDRVGRRPIILLSNFGLGLDYVLMALAPNLRWLFVGRVISGITAASVSTAGAYIADVTAAEQRAAKFGLLGAAFGAGFVVGPALGGLLGDISPRLPFWVAAGLSLTNGLYGLFVLPESLPRERRAPFSWRKANPIGALKLLRSHHELWGLAGVTFLSNLAHAALPSTAVLYMGYRYNWDAKAVGLLLAGVGVCQIVVNAVLVSRVVKAIGERQTILVGLVAGTAGFTIQAMAPNGALYAVGIVVMSLWSLMGPALQGWMTRLVSPSEQGRLQGANGSVLGIATLIGPILFTQTFANFIGPHRDWHLPGAPFLLSAILLVSALAVALRVMATRLQSVPAANQ
ncbi:MAG TPA: TCR/Tet family MFS transporter [Steroidobacteraceae bacterium]|nr:TCR/Tet family MFS transporter [Steroidobacteraceae bacterium]